MIRLTLYLVLLLGFAAQGYAQCEAITFGGVGSSKYVRKDIGSLIESNRIHALSAFSVDDVRYLSGTNWATNIVVVMRTNAQLETFIQSADFDIVEAKESSLDQIRLQGGLLQRGAPNWGYNEKITVAAGATNFFTEINTKTQGVSFLEWKVIAVSTSELQHAFYHQSIIFDHLPDNTVTQIGPTNTYATFQDNNEWAFSLVHNTVGGGSPTHDILLFANGDASNATTWTIQVEYWGEVDIPSFE